MRLLDFFRLARRRTSSAETAKQRLQVLVALDRSGGGADFLPLLQRELLDVIRKYVEIDPNRVKVELERGPDCSVLEVNVELPSEHLVRRVAV